MSASVQRRRARGEAGKQARADDILAAAEALYLERGGDLSPVAEIAERVGVAKGTFYLYYRTKEEVYVALLQQQLGAWIDAIASDLPARGAPLSADGMVEAILAPLVERPGLMSLAAQSAVALEKNVAPDVVYRFKLAMAQGHQRLGGAISEATAGQVSAELGSALMLRTYALMLGLWQLANPPAACLEVLDREGVELFRVDFDAAARAALTDLWRGPLSGQVAR